MRLAFSSDDHGCLLFPSISLSGGAAVTGGFFVNDKEESPSFLDRHAALFIGNRMELIAANIGHWYVVVLV